MAAVEQAATFTVASWLRDSLQILILVLVAFTLSWKLALGALVAVPLAVWPASRLTQALLRRIREGQASLGALAGLVKEGLGALRTLQAFNAEAAEAQRFSRYTASVERAMTRAGWARAGVPGVMEILASTAIAGTLAWAAASQSVHPEALVSFVGTVILLYQPAKDLGRVSQFAVTAAASLERLQELLDLEPAVGDAPTARDLAPLRAGITVSDLHFSWGERRALDGVSLEIPVGQVTALVGESGSGKSTLTSLLLRFERASSGRLTFDGVDVEQVTVASVRRQVALVTQEPMLFAASVRENLLVACPDANQEQVVRAATMAQAQLPSRRSTTATTPSSASAG